MLVGWMRWWTPALPLDGREMSRDDGAVIIDVGTWQRPIMMARRRTCTRRAQLEVSGAGAGGWARQLRRQEGGIWSGAVLQQLKLVTSCSLYRTVRGRVPYRPRGHGTATRHGTTRHGHTTFISPRLQRQRLRHLKPFGYMFTPSKHESLLSVRLFCAAAWRLMEGRALFV